MRRCRSSSVLSLLKLMTHSGIIAPMLVAANPTWSETVLRKRLVSMFRAVERGERVLAWHGLAPTAAED